MEVPNGTPRRAEVFEQHPGTDAKTFLQWKGTDVCIDVRCTCGAEGHLDGDFAYFVECPACGAVYEMGTAVKAIKLPAGAKGDDYDAKLLDVPDSTPSSTGPDRG